MKTFLNRQFAASRQPEAAGPVAGRWQRAGGDVIDHCRLHAPAVQFAIDSSQ